MRSSRRSSSSPADAKIQDQDYFVADANPWLDALGQAAFARLVQTSPTTLTVRPGKLGARFYDDQTLVLADLEPLQAFLNAKGSFEYQKPAPRQKKRRMRQRAPALQLKAAPRTREGRRAQRQQTSE